MRYADILLEMPELVNATDFQLMDREVNRALARKLLDQPRKDIIREDDRLILFRTGKASGSIALIDKINERITYWVRFATMKQRLTGVSTVTQVGLWRDAASPESRGVTTEVFFDYLLSHWEAIMSDREQTEAGRDFWQRQMAEASTRGLRVGFANLSGRTIDWWNGDDIANWIRGHRSAWGRRETPIKPGPYQNLRFVIARN